VNRFHRFKLSVLGALLFETVAGVATNRPPVDGDALQKFIAEKYFNEINTEQLTPVGSINEGVWSGGKWNGKWFKIDQVVLVKSKNGKQSWFVRVTTRHPLPIASQYGHYLFSEVVLEVRDRSNFLEVKKIIEQPCLEKGADYCPLESEIVGASDINSDGKEELVLNVGEGYLKVRKLGYQIIDSKWTQVYKSSKIYKKTYH